MIAWNRRVGIKGILMTNSYFELIFYCLRFSGHKIIHLDLGGAPPKLTYLLQVIPSMQVNGSLVKPL